MKNVIITTLVCLMAMVSTLSKAQEIQTVELRSKKISVSGDQVVLVRTENTPKKVKVSVRVPLRETRCAEYGTRMVTERHPSCGYHYNTRRTNCRTVCVRTVNGQCVRRERKCQIQRVRVANICSRPVSYCVRSDVFNAGYTNDKVTIKFKKLDTLRTGEEERFVLRAKQARINGYDVDYTLTPQRTLEDYTIKVREFFGDRIIIKKK